MRDIVLLSHTSANSPGGVPKWNRDFMAGFPEARHYSWQDFEDDQTGLSNRYVPEWEKGRLMAAWLIVKRRIPIETTVIGDGYWSDAFREYGFQNVVSVAHGIWSHLTKDDVDAGLLPEFPYEHAEQMAHRRRHLLRGGKIVAVSDFIATQMDLQWGFPSTVINNAVDLGAWHPTDVKSIRTRPLIIHGVTTSNKGFEHIDAVKREVDADVMLLDEAAHAFDIPKAAALAQADLVVQPSAYEGNSFFVLETLASGVPIVAYNVGLLWRAYNERAPIGVIGNRVARDPSYTVQMTREALQRLPDALWDPRGWVSQFSLPEFHRQWREFLEREVWK